MNFTRARSLIIACGNTLRSDDGVGPWLASWAEERYRAEPGLRIVSRHQWTPELAEDVARAESVLFIDCSADSAPGSVCVVEVEAASSDQALATHHVGAHELLGLARELFGSQPRAALLLTVGAGSLELGERFSKPVLDAIPLACAKVEEAVARLTSSPAPGKAQRE